MAEDTDKMLKAADEKFQRAEVASMEGLPTTDTKTFLESSPPSKSYLIENLAVRVMTRQGYKYIKFQTPGIELFCINNACMRIGFFDCLDKDPTVESRENVFLIYKCRNCSKFTKTFTLKYI